MSDLISRKYLYDKMLEKEELARQRVLDTPTHSPAYLRYVAQLNERTALKHEIADAPDVTDTNIGSKWITCSERLPEKRDWYLAVFKEPNTGFIGLPYIADYLMGNHTAYTTKDGWIIKDCTDRNDCESLYYKNLECVAWMPLPEPYKGE